jgi:hypothetical protein
MRSSCSPTPTAPSTDTGSPHGTQVMPRCRSCGHNRSHDSRGPVHHHTFWLVSSFDHGAAPVETTPQLVEIGSDVQHAARGIRWGGEISVRAVAAVGRGKRPVGVHIDVRGGDVGLAHHDRAGPIPLRQLVIGRRRALGDLLSGTGCGQRTGDRHDPRRRCRTGPRRQLHVGPPRGTCRPDRAPYGHPWTSPAAHRGDATTG